ncbi:MAG TPA: hypothetical protein VG994_10325 [Steroidobacteraceae bacterium]|nr:hypothetical protein [Steroidobacteraceae bacterium]
MNPRRFWLVALLSLSGISTALAHDVETQYQLYCMGCHVPDGSGLEGKVPSIRGTLVPLAQLPEGRRYLVQVPGVAQSPLSNAEVAALLNWMIANLSERPAPPGPVAAFTTDEVARYRSTRLVGVRATRAKVLAEANSSCRAGSCAISSPRIPATERSAR